LSTSAISHWSQHRSFALRRLHSLSGVLPVGAFLAEHLWTNASVLGGAQAFNAQVDRIQALPALWAIELFGIMLPLAFHAGYGVWLSLDGKPNVQTYPLARNWAYVLQRVTGIITFVFVVAHLYEFRLQKWLYGMHHHSFFEVATMHMSSTFGGLPLIAFGYLLGLGSAVFHLANGLSGFVISWGIVGSRRAQKRASIVFALFGLALFYLGVSSIVYLATGTRLIPQFSGSNADIPCP